MIKTKLVFTTLFLVLAGLHRVGFAADTINTDVVASVDPYGDGTITLTFRLSAAQWKNWREQYGDHPDLLWRDLKQRFAKYALDKFDLKRDDIDRTATANIVARALTTVRADGTRAIEMGKEARFVSNTGSEWIFESVGQASPYSPIDTETTRIILPARALNAHVETIGSEPQQLVYQLPDANFDNAFLLYGGLLAVAAGVIFGIVGIIFSFRPARLPPHLPPPLPR
jgi:hypothetical protein